MLAKELGISFLSRLLKPSGNSSGTPEVYLGAFGKHPGWNDHIDDLGLETQRLVDFKTLVYVEGVAAAIDSGRWDKLDADSRMEGFSHVLALRARGDLLLARLWTSRDGKGRSKYPMAVVAQVRGVPLEWALSTVLPELESIQNRCENATTAAQVVAILDSARASIRAKAAEAPSGGAEVTIPPEFLPALADRPGLGPARQGLYRILYQLQREAALFEIGAKPPSRSGSMGGKGGANDAPPSVHLRLPAVPFAGNAENRGGRAGSGPETAAAMRGCLWLLLSRLEPWAPLLIVAPEKRPILDVVVGEPQGTQLFALQAGEKVLPLTTEIPYTIDPGFASQTDGWIAAQRSQGVRSIPFSSDNGAKRAGTSRFLVLALAAGAALGMSAIQSGASQRFRADQPVPAPQAAGQQEPRLRYNNELSNLKLAVMNPQAPDAEVAAAAKKFLADVRSLPGGIAHLAEVQRLLGGIEQTLSRAGPEEVPLQALTLGPGSTSAFTGAADGKMLRFKGVGENAPPELDFARVDMPSGEVLFLATTECSVGQFAGIVSTSDSGATTSELGAGFRRFDPVSDPRDGPRSWEWSERKGDRAAMVPARAWLARRSLSAASEYPADSTPAPPIADSPMNYVSPDAAMYVARLAGCRLPRSAEWAAANAKFEQRVQLSACNLRDQTWRKQFDFVVGASDAFHKLQSPDAGIFMPAPGAGAHAGSSPGAAHDWSDSILWFTPVGVGPGEIVHNLVGNVAEYLVELPPGADDNLPEARPGAVHTFMSGHAGQVRVIGGSALSDPALDPASPLPVMHAEADEGYADVGFRLCFSAGSGANQPLAVRLNRLLDPLPTLPVR